MPKKPLQSTQTSDFHEKLKALFAKAQAKAQARTDSGSTDYTDKRILKFKSGTKYRLRLLFYPGEERDTPFINTYVHSYYDPTRRKYGSVICPTSEFAQGNAGFDSCPICTACNAFWNSSQMGDKEAEQMYRKFRRRAQNYAVVYVVSSTEPEEDNSRGQFKIIKYGFDFARFFQQYIFGIPQRNMPPLEDDEIVGYKAFDLENGYDLIISVGTKDTVINGEHVTFNDYNLKFANKTSAVDITEDDVASAFKELKFDEDFYKVSSEEELNEFFNTFINTESKDLDTVQPQIKPKKPIQNTAETEDVPYDFEDTPKKKDKFSLGLDDEVDTSNVESDENDDDDWGDFEIPD